MKQSWGNINEKVVIVTGGASGIGKSIASKLHDNGAIVVIADLSLQTGYQNSGVFGIECDVTSKENVASMVSLTLDKFGTIDGLINNAGINFPRLLVDQKDKHSEYELSESDFDSMVAVNQKGPFLCTQAVVRHMITKNKGVIVNVSSEAGKEGSAGQSCYAGTKGALNAFTRSWAKELGKYQIRVVGVAPGINEKTELTNDSYNKALAYTRGVEVNSLGNDYSKSIPLQRVGNLEEISDLVLYLVSDSSSYITGTIISINGGKSR